MKQTDNFFVIHNFNTVPKDLVDLCENYVIYDCSTDEDIKKELHTLYDGHVIDVENTGHNITSYFSYFAENYDNLPEVICLLKGNMIGRHCSKEFFENVYDNKSFTFLYEDKQSWNKYGKFNDNNEKNELGIAFIAMENVYLEKNDSWYVSSPEHPKKYFNDVDDMMRFIFKTTPPLMIPQYFMFSPGACYIIRKEHVLRRSREFYLNMNKLMNYGMNPSFPSEAHQIERLLPIIFTSQAEVNDWMKDLQAFDDKLPECSAYIQYKYDNRPRKFKKLRQMLGLIK